MKKKWLYIGGVIAILAIIGTLGGKDEPAAAVKSAVMTAEEKAADSIAQRKKMIEKSFSPWDGSHRALEKYIKKSMDDPDSYEHVETKYWDMGEKLVVLTEFRGKNAFGGVVKNSIKAEVTLDGTVLKVFE